MGRESTFQEILEEKLQSPSQKMTSFSLNPSFEDPAHLAYLLGNLQVSYWRPPSARIYPAGPRPLPRPHALSPGQQSAFDFFTQQLLLVEGMALSPAFSRRELKRAFRRLALRLHPDTNKGTPGPFIELKMHYESLLYLFSA